MMISQLAIGWISGLAFSQLVRYHDTPGQHRQHNVDKLNGASRAGVAAGEYNDGGLITPPPGLLPQGPSKRKWLLVPHGMGGM